MQYNEKQQEVARVRDAFIAEGVDKTTAARYALTAMPKKSKTFVEDLSDGGLTIEDGAVVVVPPKESAEEPATT